MSQEQGKSGHCNVFIAMGKDKLGCNIVEKIVNEHSKKISHICVGMYERCDELEKELKKHKVMVIHLEKDNSEQVKKYLDKNTEVLIIPPEHSEMTKVVESTLKGVQEAQPHCVGLTSWIGAEHSKGSHLKQFYQLEQCFKQLNAKHRCLFRIDLFQEEIMKQAPVMQDKGQIVLNTGDGKFSPVCMNEISCAFAKLLAEHQENIDEQEVNTLYFTGPKSITGEELTKVASEVLQVKYKFIKASREECRKALEMNEGINKGKLELILDYYDVISEGHGKDATDDLKKILGQDPKPIDEFLKKNANYFKPQH